MKDPDPSRRLLELLGEQRILGIVRSEDRSSATERLRALLDAGLAVTEVSLSTPGALEVVAAAREVLEDAGLRPLIGAGTVMTAHELQSAAEAGCDFVVTPTTDRAVLAAGAALGVPVISGAATPTEIRTAVDGGAVAVKLFPASLWTVAAFRDLRTVFGAAPFVPTGGIGPEHARAWIDAGALAVGMGSALTSGAVEPRELLEALSVFAEDGGSSAIVSDVQPLD